MGDSDLTVAVTRLKREDCKRTKHDSHFSNWKILVGPSDWEDYSLGIEGAERYRVHNLPEKESPGVYELGIAVLRTGLGREIGKLDPDYIVPVYLGQADNVRTRLQQYGRSGAHLGNGCPTGHPSDRVQKGPGLFAEILSRDYPVVYRWAPMENKSVALKTETQLLNTFDYAWNTNINGARRPDDVLKKLKMVSSRPTRFVNIAQKFVPFSPKKVGTRIESSILLSPEDKFSAYANRESHNPLSRVFKLGRSQPRLVLDRIGITPENTIICGVDVGDGSICRMPPVLHKGICRISNSHQFQEERESECSAISSIEFHGAQIINSDPVESFASICGFILADGSVCRTPPVPGRKRCAKHKGMRINGSTRVGISNSTVDSESECSAISSIEFHGAQIINSDPVESFASICGFILADGSSCRRHPIQGRKRCDEHKGMRINRSTRVGISNSTVDSESEYSAISSRVFHDAQIINRYPVESFTSICGIILPDGSSCRRHPIRGRKRCDEHKGKRI
ncbi:PREDICTED: EFFECTOR OF [Prunus dulcis]|uniref:PREDICTED: EFFECTOR OF n=1 Tax=Prunus dulcis TaxID=3755 RepID=A0A5E4E425_PRUDU|nr:PREDICTED: EFFECTOR OF [Prunus dulcis]